MGSALASFVIPAFNAEATIAETIHSLSDCGIDDFEVIVVDDGSADRTFDVALKAAARFRNQVVKLNRNSGLASALNIGISLASGGYLARMDADDVCLLGRLSKQIAHMEAFRDVAFCGGNLRNFGSNDNLIRYPFGQQNCTGSLPAYCCHAHSSVTFDMSRIKQQLYYDSRFPVAEDYHLWASLCAGGIFGDNIDLPCTGYRVHETQMTQKNRDAFYIYNLHIRQKIISSMLYSDRFMSSLVFALHLTTGFNYYFPEFVSATLELIDLARPLERFEKSWEITKFWLRRLIVNFDQSAHQQKTINDLTSFAIIKYGDAMRSNSIL